MTKKTTKALFRGHPDMRRNLFGTGKVKFAYPLCRKCLWKTLKVVSHDPVVSVKG